MRLPKLSKREKTPGLPELPPSVSPRHEGFAGKLIQTFFGAFFVAVVLALIGRGVMIFFIDPVPKIPSLILLVVGYVAGAILIWNGRFRIRFFSDTLARRTIAVIVLVWMAAMTVKATVLAQRYDYLSMYSGCEAYEYISRWGIEILMSFPLSTLVMEDNIIGSLAGEYLLMENPLLTRYVVNCLYWPILFTIEGAFWWTFLFFCLRASVRLVKFLIHRFCSVHRVAEMNRAAEAKPITEVSTRKSFFHVVVIILSFVLVAWMIHLSADHIRRTSVWNRDFNTARMIIARFFLLNSRHPYTWDEIVEADFAQDTVPRRSLPQGVHYFKNPGFRDRAELNFDYLRRIDFAIKKLAQEPMGENMDENNAPVGTGSAVKSPFSPGEWIFRIRPVSGANRTGKGDQPFVWNGWTNSLTNLVAQDLVSILAGQQPSDGLPAGQSLDDQPSVEGREEGESVPAVPVEASPET